MSRHSILLLLSVSALCSVPAVKAAGPLATLQHEEFRESFRDEAPVSGRVVAGISASGLAGGGLALLPPPSAGGRDVCVTVVSRDGRYWSQNTYRMPGALDAGPVALEYPSSHQDFLDALQFGELAVLSMAAGCDDADGESFYVSSAGKSSDQEPGINIFVNSGRADSYVAVRNVEGYERPRPCREIQDGRRTGFDTVCRIETANMLETINSLEVRILRRRYERMLPPTEFTLLISSAR